MATSGRSVISGLAIVEELDVGVRGLPDLGSKCGGFDIGAPYDPQCQSQNLIFILDKYKHSN